MFVIASFLTLDALDALHLMLPNPYIVANDIVS